MKRSHKPCQANREKRWIFEGFLDALPTIAKEYPGFCILGKEVPTHKLGG